MPVRGRLNQARTKLSVRAGMPTILIRNASSIHIRAKCTISHTLRIRYDDDDDDFYTYTRYTSSHPASTLRLHLRIHLFTQQLSRNMLTQQLGMHLCETQVAEAPCMLDTKATKAREQSGAT